MIFNAISSEPLLCCALSFDVLFSDRSMSKRGICQTRFYGAKETSDSSVCSTSEDDIFERSDIVIPPTDMSDETGKEMWKLAIYPYKLVDVLKFDWKIAKHFMSIGNPNWLVS